MYKYYLLALFIFLLLTALIFICVKLIKSAGKGGTSITEKERRLFLLYQNLDEMMNSIEAYIEESKTEIRAEKEMVLELLREKSDQLQESDKDIDPVEVGYKTVSQKPDTTPKPDTPIAGARAKIQEPNNHKKVASLKEKGMNAEEIARELKISRGEVSLILGILKR